MLRDKVTLPYIFMCNAADMQRILVRPHDFIFKHFRKYSPIQVSHFSPCLHCYCRKKGLRHAGITNLDIALISHGPGYPAAQVTTVPVYPRLKLHPLAFQFVVK